MTTPKNNTSDYRNLARKDLKEYIGEGLKSTGFNLNVLNILRTFIEDKYSTVYIPSNYKRGTSKRIDEKVHHGQKSAPTVVEIDDFVSHSSRFNFSVRGLKEVQVEKEDGSLLPVKVFRSYNIIRDGELVIDELEAKLSYSTYTILVAAGLVYDQVGRQVSELHPYHEDYVYTVSLKGIKLVSPQWAKPNHIKLYDLMQLESYISDRVKLLSKLAKDRRIGAPSNDQIYRETPSVSQEETRESKEVECIEYKLKGSSVEKPSVDESLSDDQLLEQLVSDRKYKNYLRFIIRSVIFAIESSAKKGSYNWSDELPVPRSKSKSYKHTTVTDSTGSELVLKRYTWFESVPVS
ncbi:VWA domain-containing protein [Listeria phage LIS04]|nr:VWA domain-containing protein [Listeria phage LIS04]